ncbi:MAG TPA: DUF1641 domain-containing protein [Acidobacteriaceae bacterium]|nr:DUF1641 domain-containing protein [Acidobacteriaceae bacterium]
MAKPIEFIPAQHDAREDLKQRIDNAPVEHAAAVLSAYELLEELHRSGTLDVLRGFVGAGGEIVTQASSLAAQPQSIRALRNLLVLGKLLGSIDPDLLHRLAQALPAAAETPHREPPSLFDLLRRFNSPGSRRALAAAAEVLEGMGRGLDTGK